MRYIIVSLLANFGSVALCAAAPETVPEPTLRNLQAAFNGESNAHARYLACAANADKEGYAGVASLFRAAARAEEIHAGNHAAVIKEYGRAPEMKLDAVQVKSTRDNLETAIKGETYERDEMYPAFLSQANSDDSASAARTFRFALAAEAEHAKLFANALKNLERMRTSRAFYVYPACGFTVAKLDFNFCPTCATPNERFEQVS